MAKHRKKGVRTLEDKATSQRIDRARLDRLREMATEATGFEWKTKQLIDRAMEIAAKHYEQEILVRKRAAG